MATQTDFDYKEFCLKLLMAETEEEIIEILKKTRFLGGSFGLETIW